MGQKGEGINPLDRFRHSLEARRKRKSGERPDITELEPEPDPALQAGNHKPHPRRKKQFYTGQYFAASHEDANYYYLSWTGRVAQVGAGAWYGGIGLTSVAIGGALIYWGVLTMPPLVLMGTGAIATSYLSLRQGYTHLKGALTGKIKVSDELPRIVIPKG